MTSFSLPAVMGILNITPDSFSGDGLITGDAFIQNALKRTALFLEQGANIIDIGGESTRPGAELVSEDQEMERVLPVLKAIYQTYPHIRLSIDTRRSNVARAALECGVTMINDVSGLMHDTAMIDLVRTSHAEIVIMHSLPNAQHIEQTELGGRFSRENTQDIVRVVYRDLEKTVLHAISQGVDPKKIILDPGIGFGKTSAQNFELIARLGELKKLGYPVLLGASRKAFIGYETNSKVQNRMGGSLAASLIGASNGADIVRVHDVLETVQALKILEAVQSVSV